MIANNGIFFSVWWVFFKQFRSVAGWSIDDMTALLTIGTGAYGITQICFGGIKTLSETIVNGDLDSFMTQPKNIPLHVISSRSLSRGWGNVSTAALFLCIGPFNLASAFLACIGMVCGSLVFTAVGIMAHASAFWFGPVQAVSKKYCDALFLFALYPTHIYSGFLQFVMFTFIPAGIIGYLPVELVRDFSLSKLFFLVLGASGFFATALALFHKGLKRYESGNRFGIKL